jgi:uncharacterized protein (UPF0216 family)
VNVPRSSTETLARALDLVAPHIQTDDGVVSAMLVEASQRLRDQAALIEEAREEVEELLAEYRPRVRGSDLPRHREREAELVGLIARMRAANEGAAL